jgi:hypothetical protein
MTPTPAPFSNAPTQDEIARRQKMAQLLMGQATDASPVGHWTQALARVVKGGVGGMWDNQARQGQQDRQSAVIQALSGDPSFAKMTPGMQGMLANDPQLLLKLKLMQAQTGLVEAQASAARQKDELNSAIAGIIKGDAPPAPQPQPQPPMLQPQSFGGGPNVDPMLIQTQTAGAGSQPAPPEMVNTPLGPMPIDVAKRRALGLSLAGKGDAGKMLLDEANADKLGKTAQGEVEKELVGLTGTIGRLESLGKRFDPEFLKIPERAGFAWSGLKEKFGSLPPDQKKSLAAYTRFRQTSINNAALYVKYLSGVAVSEQEFQRIMKTLPNAGSGIFDGDSPTEYVSKMQEAIVQSKMAVARAMHLKRNGFKGKPWEAGIALDDMRGIIDQRGDQIEQQLQGRVPPDQMRDVVGKQLKQEFGI